MTLQSAPAGRARPAGRGPKIRAAVLAATLAELTETGYTALTVDNVARRAGVHKTTIYRRWKDREGLVADAVADRAGDGENALPRHRRHRHRSSQARTDDRRVPGQPGGRDRRRRVDVRCRPDTGGRWREAPLFRGPLPRKLSRSSPAPSHAGSFPPAPIQPSWSEPFSHRSTCGSWSPPSRSTKPPPTTPPRWRSPPPAPAHSGQTAEVTHRNQATPGDREKMISQNPPNGPRRPPRATLAISGEPELIASDLARYLKSGSGANGTRTPDPLLANNRHHVHQRPCPQVTVPERVSASLQIRTCCSTFVLYSTEVRLPAGARLHGTARGQLASARSTKAR